METEYRFDELEIEVNGILVGGFRGVATLTTDPGYTFYVSAIVLDGEKCTKRRRWPYTGFDRADAKLVLTKDETSAPGQFLFKALCDALDNTDTQSFWANAVEENRWEAA